MSPVAVVTDTTHYLPRALADARGIHQVSLYVAWAGDSTRELDLDGFDGFYARLRSASDLPTTSQPSIGDFLTVWEPLLRAGRDVVSVHLAGGISGTVGAARQAMELLDERGHDGRIVVIDGETSCGGLGALALAGATVANAGGDLDAVAAHIREARDLLRMWFCLDTLEYLQRGGRIGKAQMWLGSALKVKPILSLGYEITPVERVRTSGRAFERMVDFLRSLANDGADGWVLQHIQAPDVMARLVERGREIFGTDPLFTSEIGPVIGTYTGPGLIGVAGVPRRMLDPPATPDPRAPPG